VTAQVAVATVVPTKATPIELAERKGEHRISVCLPARNEAATVGPICELIVRACMQPDVHGRRLVDELVVLDDGSTDDTAAIAAGAGARVVAIDDILPELPRGSGKGNVLWKSLAVSDGDIVVWCDTDLTSFTETYVTRLVAPLLDDPQVQFVKGFYRRPLDEQGHGGGRTTELVARPLLSRFFPTLATIHQPLGGECAARRSLLEQLPFVESGLLIDVLNLAGVDAMAQVDLGVRTHRHRGLDQLSHQAAEILAIILRRAGHDDHEVTNHLPPLVLADGSIRPVHLDERPPMRTVLGRSSDRQ
jgi:glucosyl-3-phosphoglycerate synthase